jgi:hypothetical protein
LFRIAIARDVRFFRAAERNSARCITFEIEGLCDEGKRLMNKLILIATVLLIAGDASAYAQSANSDGRGGSSQHTRMMSAHARFDGPVPGMAHRGFLSGRGSGGGGPSYGGSSDAEGRTSGG